MALIQTVRFNFGRKIACQARLHLNANYKSSVKMINTSNTYIQVRYFRDRIRNESIYYKRIRIPEAKLKASILLASIQNKAFPGFAKPIAFTVAFCASSFVGVLIWEYEVIRRIILGELSEEEKYANIEKTYYAHIEPTHKSISWRNKFQWKELDDGQRFAAGLIGCNLLVFLLWRIPRLQPIMIKYFCSSPLSKALCWPMALSCFSHISFIHLFCNMNCLYNFSDLVKMLRPPEFLAIYLSAGVVASLASYVARVATGTPAVLSLGASGGVMGVFGFACIYFSERLQLEFIFAPGYRFSSASALNAAIAFDTIGLFLRWKFIRIDHAAHLGGLFFGIGYALWGKDYVREKGINPFLIWWDYIRGPILKDVNNK